MHEAHVAAAAFNDRVIPSVAHTDPEVACVGTHAGDMMGEIALAVARTRR